MKRTILTFKNYFEKFMAELTLDVQQKIKYVLLLFETQDRMPIKFVKLIKEGIYELRIEYEGNIYRVFFIFDEGNILVLFNGFQKKKQKTPPNEIEKALNIKREYYEYKQQQSNSRL